MRAVIGFNGPPEDCPAGTVPVVAADPDDYDADGTLRAGAFVFLAMPPRAPRITGSTPHRPDGTLTGT